MSLAITNYAITNLKQQTFRSPISAPILLSQNSNTPSPITTSSLINFFRPHWIHTLPAVKKEGYLEKIQKAYDAFYTAQNVSEALYALDQIFKNQRILLENFDYQPKDLFSTCSDCKQKSLTLIPENQKYFTPENIPESIKKYLIGINEFNLVSATINHIFFVANPKNYPNIFYQKPMILGTGDPVTKSVLISEPLDNLIEPLFAAGLAHEAFHFKNNDSYPKYSRSERDAFTFEIKLLNEIQSVFKNTLTDFEKTAIDKRINSLKILKPH